MQTTNLYKDSVKWQTLNCEGVFDYVKHLEGLNINLVTVSLVDPDVKMMPYQAQTANQLASLPQIADSLSAQYNVIAGINGGYFYRNDITNFKDNICGYKTFTPPKPGDSMGDSLLQHDGQSFATNCAFWPGVADRPRASMILTGTDPISGKKAPYITLVNPDTVYDQAGVIPDAIGAGPNLVTDGKLSVDNPDENLLPTLEFAANSAVGIIKDGQGNPTQMVFFTVDGNDDSFKQGWPAMNAIEMGDFLLNYVKVSDAMSMDQGGSTTMYVGASDLNQFPEHVVSNSNYKPGVPLSEHGVRNLYDGLFVVVPKN